MSPEQRLALTAIHASFLAGILVFLAITLTLAPDRGPAPALWRWA